MVGLTLICTCDFKKPFACRYNGLICHVCPAKAPEMADYSGRLVMRLLDASDQLLLTQNLSTARFTVTYVMVVFYLFSHPGPPRGTTCRLLCVTAICHWDTDHVQVEVQGVFFRRQCQWRTPLRAFPVRDIYLVSGQLSLAIHSWVGAMSTSQMAVTPCGWGV